MLCVSWAPTAVAAMWCAPGSGGSGPYREQMLGRQSPASRGEPRRDRVLLVDRISPTLALAKVQLEMMGGVMQDSLNLVHLDGQWWIIAKMWERVGDSAA